MLTSTQTNLKSAISSKETEPTNPEVKPKNRTRRRFTAARKLALLDTLDRCPTAEAKGELMRREGLYSSSVSEWRKARARGELSALHEKRGRKKKYSPEQHENITLQREIGRLKQKLTQAEALIDLQKKVSEIFGLTPIQYPPDEKN